MCVDRSDGSGNARSASRPSADRCSCIRRTGTPGLDSLCLIRSTPALPARSFPSLKIGPTKAKNNRVSQLPTGSPPHRSRTVDMRPAERHGSLPVFAMLGRIRFRLLPDTRPQTGSMSVHSWRNLGMPVRAVGSQENLFSSGAPQSQRTRAMRDRPRLLAGVQSWCRTGVVRLPKRTSRTLDGRCLPPQPEPNRRHPTTGTFDLQSEPAGSRAVRDPPAAPFARPQRARPSSALSPPGSAGFAPIAWSRASSDHEVTLSHVCNFREQAAHPIRRRGLNRDLEWTISQNGRPLFLEGGWPPVRPARPTREKNAACGPPRRAG
jgi:hypothetical protein